MKTFLIVVALLFSFSAKADLIKCSGGFGPGIHYAVTFDTETRWLHVQDKWGGYAEGVAIKAVGTKGTSYHLPYGFNVGAQFFTEPLPMTLCMQENECYRCDNANSKN